MTDQPPSHHHKIIEYDQCHSSEPSLDVFDTPIPSEETQPSEQLWGPAPLKNLKLWIVYPPVSYTHLRAHET